MIENACLTHTYVCVLICFFFFNDTATTEIYTLSLHDALPICQSLITALPRSVGPLDPGRCRARSEEHTSELQSHDNLVCRLLLEKNKKHTSAGRHTLSGGDLHYHGAPAHAS